MQMAGDPRDRAGWMYGVMTPNIGSNEYNAVDTEGSPLLSAAGDEITFNDRLFARIKPGHASRDRGPDGRTEAARRRAATTPSCARAPR